MKRWRAALLLGTLLCGVAHADKLPLEGKIIVVDPGHAVKDDSGSIINPGARAKHGEWERDVAMNVALKLADLLEAQGAKVFLTRTAGNPWRYSHRKAEDNRSRALLANVLRANVYVRLHCDWNRSKKFEGYTTYYYRWGSRPFAKAIHHAMEQALPDHRDNGIHRRAFVSVTARMPAVLVELGVLSNRKEGAALGIEAFRTRLARSVAKGVVGYFQTGEKW